MDLRQYELKVFSKDGVDFESMALDVFRFQYDNNRVYREYIDALSLNVAGIGSIAQIPFLPIGFFKSHRVTSTGFEPQAIFRSSGTTGSVNSQHFVRELGLYSKSFTHGFERAYGPVKDWCILGLLPSYLERGDSSLVYMVDHLIRESGHLHSGFYLDDFERLARTLSELEKAGQRTLLIGVTFALLDFAEKFPLQLRHTILMETGGMKGRRKEIIRPEVHELLKQAFGVEAIHSEYGMTELLSQAYSTGEGIFSCPPWLQILIRDDEDPLTVMARGQLVLTGAINIIDLANIYSCSFIATDDIGRLHPGGQFEVLGRMDNSDIRGCSLMVAGGEWGNGK
jgi:hypothetical protein